ncbi:MAG: histidine--tRNA ligase [Armatimonadota bacterium]|nr:MAG: histidine--tRNA ligase [Armatimonadota bacterium]
MRYSAPRGTQDILPEDVCRWQRLEACFRDLCARYGYREIRTPVFEDMALFARAVGEETDIVAKEMYVFEDRGGRAMALRPEGTAPVVRAYVQHKLYGLPGAQKLYYIAPIFRYERPQAGRYRQHHQVGVEAIGAPGPDIDAEIIALGRDLLDALGVSGGRLEINSVGCRECRPQYRQTLQDALRPVLSELCEVCQGRFDRNPMRILDDKNERCRELTADAPRILDHLCAACRGHFEGLQQCLADLGLEYHVNARIVRGLDYYARTAFEIIHDALAAKDTVIGGGRYDGLVEELGGPPTPGVGFGAGVERMLLIMEAQGAAPPRADGMVYVAAADDAARKAALRALRGLRSAGIAADMDYSARSLKAQMKEANRVGASRVVILGEDELRSGAATVRDMATGEQTQVALSDLPGALGGKVCK